MRSPLNWKAALAGSALVLGLAGCTALPAAGTPRVRVVSVQAGNSATIDDSAEGLTIDITSERGIGKAEFERLGPPPQALNVNLHLKGLEELRWRWGDTAVLVHVSSAGGSVREEVSLGGAQATPIDSTSPYWAPVQIEAKDPTIPLEDGFFAVTAPPAFLQAAPASFSLQWIDFYR